MSSTKGEISTELIKHALLRTWTDPVMNKGYSHARRKRYGHIQILIKQSVLSVYPNHIVDKPYLARKNGINIDGSGDHPRDCTFG
jgi:hypothetical protein